MSSQTATSTLRIKSEGGKQVERDIIDVGRTAKKSFKQVKDSAGTASKGLGAVDNASKGLQNTLRNLGQTAAVVTGPLGGISSRLIGIASIMKNVGPLGLAISASLAAITVATSKSIAAFSIYEKTMFRVEAVLKATGHASGQTGQEINQFAEELARSTLASAEGVRSAAAALATFKSVGGDAFKQTLTVAQDLAAVLGQDLRSTTVQLGKALEDPVRGMTSLRRVGISFTNEQTNMIKTMQESGRTAEAQTTILGLLESQVGGAGAAEGKGLTGSYDLLADNITRFFENLAESTGMAEAATDVMNSFADAAGRAADIVSSDAKLSDNQLAARMEDGAEKAKVYRERLISIEETIEKYAARKANGNGGRAINALADSALAQRVIMQAKLADQQAKNASTTAEQNKRENDRTRAQLAMEKANEQRRLDHLAKRTAAMDKISKLLGKDLKQSTLQGDDAERNLVITKAEAEIRAKIKDVTEAEVKAHVKKRLEIYKTAKAVKETAKDEKKAADDRVKDLATFDKRRKKLEAEIKAMDAIIDGDRARAELIKVQAALEAQIEGSLSGPQAEALEKLIVQHQKLKAVIEGQKQDAEDKAKEAERYAELMGEPMRNMLRGVHDAGVSFFEDLFSGAINSAGDAARAIRDVFIRYLAEVAAFKLFGANFAGQLMGGVGGGGSVGSIAAGAAGSAGGGGGGFMSGFMGLLGAGGGAAGMLGGVGASINGFGSSLGFASSAYEAELATMFGDTGLLGGQTATQALGAGAAGALATNVLAGMFGVKGSAKTGATIGGGIGAAVGGPIGWAAGSLIGGIGGALFGKTSKSGATVKVGADGQVIGSNVFARGSGNAGVAQQLAEALAQELTTFASKTGGTLTPGATIGQIGKRKDDYIFSATPGSEKQFGKSFGRHYDTADEAVNAGALNALRSGAITGLSKESMEVLRTATNLTDALEKIREIEEEMGSAMDLTTGLGLAILQLANEEEFARQGLIQSQKDRLQLFEMAGADMLDVERLFLLERQKMIEQQTAATLSTLNGFLREMTVGNLSGLSKSDQLGQLRAEIGEMVARINAGETVDAGLFQSTGQQFLTASQGINASSPEYVNDRNMLIDATRLLTQNVGAENVSFLDGEIVSGLTELTNVVAGGTAETNAILNDIAGLLSGSNAPQGNPKMGGGGGGSDGTGGTLKAYY